jgi:uncharacterized protein DUF4153
MKTIDIFILIATAAYSYLFYMQSPGLNFLLFSMLIVLLFFLTDKSLVARAAWLPVATGTVLSGFCVFWWGTTLPLLANVCSLFMLAGLSFNPESSLLVAAFNTFISTMTSIPRIFSGSVRATQPNTGNTSTFSKVLLFIVPAIVTLIFVFVYRAANPIFEKFTDKISFDFISFNWCLFTLFGFFFVFGLFKQYAIRKVNEADSQSPDTLQTITPEQHLLSDFGKHLSVPNELLTGIILFVMLNLVLLCVNGLDVFYMWVAARLPEGITLAEYLHDGADTLIFSIIMAIAVILFVFRGYLNFFENNKWPKILAYTWIAQNVLLVITTANRNWWIIESTGLTRKRIGVYVYLLLCLVGLATTFIKVMQRKSNWFLFRKNAWVFYAVFIISCFVNWDELIVNYNCKHFKELELGYIDRSYQAGLSHTCLASLFKYYLAEKKAPNPSTQVFTQQVVVSMYASYEVLKEREAKTRWQSYCISKKQTLDEVNATIKNNPELKTPDVY